MNKRIENEKKHGEFLAPQAGLVWSWETPAGKRRWQRRVNMLTSQLNLSDKVLELGCGTGYFSKELDKKSGDITAIDISEDLLKKAQELNLKQTKFVLMDAHHLTFSDNCFDHVVGSSVLHHLETEQALREVYRVLKPGGTIAFTEPNMLNPQIAVQKNIPIIKKWAGDSPDETAFFKREMQDYLSKIGFKSIEIVYFDFLHPSIPEGLINLMEPVCLTMEKIPGMKMIAGSLFIRATK